MLASKLNIWINTSSAPQGSENIVEKWVKGRGHKDLEDSENAQKCCLLLMAWLLHTRTHGSCGDLNKIKPVSIPAWIREGLKRPTVAES